MTLTPAVVPAQTTVPAREGAQLDGTLGRYVGLAQGSERKNLHLTERAGIFVQNPALKGATIDGISKT